MFFSLQGSYMFLLLLGKLVFPCATAAWVQHDKYIIALIIGLKVETREAAIQHMMLVSNAKTPNSMFHSIEPVDIPSSRASAQMNDTWWCLPQVIATRWS